MTMANKYINPILVKHNKFYVLFVLLLTIVSTIFYSDFSYADAERKVKYFYDNAGNIISIEAGTNLGEPTISDITPPTIRATVLTRVTASGDNLNFTTITTDHSGLIASNIVSSKSEVIFDIKADKNVPLGQHTLTFNTNLGSATIQIEILLEPPKLIVLPAPLTMEPGGEVVDLDIYLTFIDIVDYELDISSSDENVATVNISNISIPVGETTPNATVRVTSVNKGISYINIGSETLNVFVTDRYVPDVGDHDAFSKPISLYLPGQESNTNAKLVTPLISPVLSVNKQNNANEIIGPVISPITSINKQNSSSEVIEPVVSPVMSVFQSSGAAIENTVSPVVSPVLSINKEETP